MIFIWLDLPSLIEPTTESLMPPQWPPGDLSGRGRRWLRLANSEWRIANSAGSARPSYSLLARVRTQYVSAFLRGSASIAPLSPRQRGRGWREAPGEGPLQQS